MDSQVQSQTPIQPQRVTPYVSLVQTIIVSISMLGIGLAVGYLVFGNKNQAAPAAVSQRTEVSPTPMQTLSPTSTSVDTSSWKTYTDNKTFSIKYPPTWNMTRGLSQVGALMYNPSTVYTVTGNGGGKTQRYKEYVAIYSVEQTTKSAQQVAQEFKASWAKLNTTIPIQSTTQNGLDISLYPDAGEGAYGNNYALSNGTWLAQGNTSVAALSEQSTASAILASFTFLK